MTKCIRIVIGIAVVLILAMLVMTIYGIYRFVVYERAKDALFIALENNDLETMDNVLAKCPRAVNARQVTIVTIFHMDVANNTLLVEAIFKHKTDAAKLLVEKYGADVNRRAGNRQTPLLEALRQGDYDMAWYLINHGADVFKTEGGSWNETVPFAIVGLSISENDYEEAKAQLDLLKYVIEQGVPLDTPKGGTYGIQTLLGFAAYKNNWLVVDYLIEAEVFEMDDIVTDDNRTSLICAAENGSYDACKALLAHGANKDVIDAHGMTAYDYAVQLNDTRMIELLS